MMMLMVDDDNHDDDHDDDCDGDYNYGDVEEENIKIMVIMMT